MHISTSLNAGDEEAGAYKGQRTCHQQEWRNWLLTRLVDAVTARRQIADAENRPA